MGKILNAILIDNEPAAIANLQELLNDHREIRVMMKLSDATQAVEAVLEHRPDVLFLDIQMPGATGFEIAKELMEAGDPPAIVFVTGFDRFAIEAIRHAAFDFLVKPVTREDLAQAVERLKQTPVKADNRENFTRLIERTLLKPRIKISNTGGFSLINPADIVFIQADWNYSELFFGDGKSELATMNIGSLEESLPEHDFFRISRSVIINVNYLVKVSRKKREATLIKDGAEFKFTIPLLNIRKLERFLE